MTLPHIKPEIRSIPALNFNFYFKAVCRSLLLAAIFSTPALLATPALAASYTVQAGDSLWSISQRLGLSVEQLRAANGISGSLIEVGQVLRLPAALPAKPAGAAHASGAAPATPTSLQLGSVSIGVPARTKMGDAFVLTLAGAGAENVRVRFPSEKGADYRFAGEWVKPVKVGGQWVVLGRSILGQEQPVTFEAKLGGETVRGSLSVSPLGQPVQVLNVPPSVAAVLQDPRREQEKAAVEAAYQLRGQPAWTQPFANAIAGGRRSSGFGQPRRERAGSPIKYHFGMDYAAPAGTRVQAINLGRVVIAERFPVRGGLVAIDHGGGLLSLYFHLSQIDVKVGQSVDRGQKIGEVGSTGYSTGPHLHLELRLRGEAVDPAAWVGRMLP